MLCLFTSSLQCSAFVRLATTVVLESAILERPGRHEDALERVWCSRATGIWNRVQEKDVRIIHGELFEVRTEYR